MLANKVKGLALPFANAVFIVLSVLYLIGIFNYPYMGLALENKEGNWTVVYGDPYGEGTRLGIHEGDIILEIDGLAPENSTSVQQWKEVEGVSTLTVVRSQGEPEVIRIAKYPYITTLSRELPMIAVGLCFWLIGLYAVFKRPLLEQARALFWLNWLIGLLFIIAPASGRGLFLAKELVFMGFPLASILLIYFIAVLSKIEKNKIFKVLIRLFWILPVVIGVTIILKWMGLVYDVSQLRTMSLASGLMGSLMSLIFLLRMLKLPEDLPEKKSSCHDAGRANNKFISVSYTYGNSDNAWHSTNCLSQGDHSFYSCSAFEYELYGNQSIFAGCSKDIKEHCDIFVHSNHSQFHPISFSLCIRLASPKRYQCLSVSLSINNRDYCFLIRFKVTC